MKMYRELRSEPKFMLEGGNDWFNGAILLCGPLREAFVEDLPSCCPDEHRFCSSGTSEGQKALASKVIFVF